MRKFLWVMLVLMVAGCADKSQYEVAVLEQMKLDKDVIDYKIAPEKMVECVVAASAKKMPGLFPFDPDRLMAYRNYSKMLEINKSQDVKKSLEDLRETFGSAKALADAHANYAESVVTCMADMVTSTEPKSDKQ